MYPLPSDLYLLRASVTHMLVDVGGHSHRLPLGMEPSQMTDEQGSRGDVRYVGRLLGEDDDLSLVVSIDGYVGGWLKVRPGLVYGRGLWGGLDLVGLRVEQVQLLRSVQVRLLLELPWVPHQCNTALFPPVPGPSTRRTVGRRSS